MYSIEIQSSDLRPFGEGGRAPPMRAMRRLDGGAMRSLCWLALCAAMLGLTSGCKTVAKATAKAVSHINGPDPRAEEPAQVSAFPNSAVPPQAPGGPAAPIHAASATENMRRSLVGAWSCAATIKTEAGTIFVSGRDEYSIDGSYAGEYQLAFRLDNGGELTYAGQGRGTWHIEGQELRTTTGKAEIRTTNDLAANEEWKPLFAQLQRQFAADAATGKEDVNKILRLDSSSLSLQDAEEPDMVTTCSRAN